MKPVSGFEARDGGDLGMWAPVGEDDWLGAMFVVAVLSETPRMTSAILHETEDSKRRG
ncbi:MAG: hypothetical protein OJF47_000866 [Nitrospira sp.]|nr:MAG: hypothetical protein OJF47_000866 [Nitrospira sp.]